MRIYVAGPMTGIPQLNFPAFHAAAATLRAEGHHVENPAEINADPAAQWLDCMRMDIARLVTCDAVYMLPGWQSSRGALVEHTLATGLGLQVMHARQPQDRARRRTVVRCDCRIHGEVPVPGWTLACGAVLHRSVLPGKKFRRFCDDDWTVTDAVCGARMASGSSMAQAMHAYRTRVQSYGDAWNQVLSDRRKKFIEDKAKAQRPANRREPKRKRPPVVALIPDRQHAAARELLKGGAA
ncbi:DUF4406 domain-containing protein [Paracidovorax konjaci]|uniref:DUF4406 domain-containing protein n=1 Tax=Paracidovorax konjaci TaxID=32040 RepID=A0A1I1XQ45_9BURK|nr:DUF4406 domain-containing protein [Paracidovorax konjaci]SFE09437.1 protein of unknown function [Paracidovorax konjaci]